MNHRKEVIILHYQHSHLFNLGLDFRKIEMTTMESVQTKEGASERVLHLTKQSLEIILAQPIKRLPHSCMKN